MNGAWHIRGLPAQTKVMDECVTRVTAVK